MVAKPNSSKTSIIPSLRFADAQAGIEWLCMAFGFEKQLVVPGEQEGDIAHAQLTLGGGDDHARVVQFPWRERLF